ncbi:hypothetical protein D9758_018961 [Tetrapyrgos nigripes]|uniref:Uncharacterized protein n=1 Tax=Tetrapyrgos nigripes TaxID=182062 RepID=A0A8H5B7S7_9AGAR|nr:hypothetical protein D9758_018961 [Tetrapyrgos nigripes]
MPSHPGCDYIGGYVHPGTHVFFSQPSLRRSPCQKGVQNICPWLIVYPIYNVTNTELENTIYDPSQVLVIKMLGKIDQVAFQEPLKSGASLVFSY